MRDAAPASQRDSRTPRALELDALAAILPIDRRDRLAELLTNDDSATLKYLAKEGTVEKSRRALASDLAYLEAWAVAARGNSPPWPAPEDLALKFASPLRPEPAGDRPRPWHACSCGRGLERGTALTRRGSPRALDGAQTLVELGYLASLEGTGWPFFLTSTARSTETFSSGCIQATDANEHACDHAGHPRSAS